MFKHVFLKEPRLFLKRLFLVDVGTGAVADDDAGILVGACGRFGVGLGRKTSASASEKTSRVAGIGSKSGVVKINRLP
jgi:hypothetical protein